MLRKLAVPMALFDYAYFEIRGSDKSPRWLQLTDFKVEKGVFSWEMISDRGEVIIGNATAEIANPALSEFDNVWIKPYIPIRMHVMNGALRLEMIWQVPNACYIKIKRPTQLVSPLPA